MASLKSATFYKFKVAQSKGKGEAQVSVTRGGREHGPNLNFVQNTAQSSLSRNWRIKNNGTKQASKQIDGKWISHS